MEFKTPKVQIKKSELSVKLKDELSAIKNDVTLTNKQALTKTRGLIKKYDEERLKFVREIDATKKELKKEVDDILEPASKYEKQLAKEVKEEEQAVIDEKLEKVKQLEGYDLFVQYNKIPKKWYNLTKTIQQIQEEIKEVNDKTLKDILDINNLCESEGIPVHSEYHNMLKENDVKQVEQLVKRDAIVIKNFLQANNALDEFFPEG